MKLASRRIKCPLCGTINPPQSDRCSVCTRPLRESDLASQRVYDEALWSERIASKRARRPVSLATIAVVVVIVAAIVNYFVVKAGPDWAHEPRTIVPGETWHSVDIGAGARLDLPGSPLVSNEVLGAVPATVSTVWVGDSWEAVLDDTTTSKIEFESALERFRGAVLVATSTGDAATPPLAELTARVAAEAALTPSAVVPTEAAANQLSWRWESSATGWPRPNVQTTVAGRAIRSGNVTVSVVTIVAGDDGGALVDAVMANLQLPAA